MTGRAVREAAGLLRDGTPVESVTLHCANGAWARVLTFGATLQCYAIPDRTGVLADIVLGHDDAASYEANRNFLGSTIGPFANRIGGASFTLDGVVHHLTANDGANTLHGGDAGFDRQLWMILDVSEDRSPSVTLTLHCPDGQGGFPGALDVMTRYSLAPDGALEIEMTARTLRPTVVSLTNHTIFNLAGEDASRSAMDHRLQITASVFTPVDAALVPTGERRSVAGTPFDFTTMRAIAVRLRDGTDAQIRYGRGYDHNFVRDCGETTEPALSARLEEPVSGRALDVLSTEPGVQLYTGNAFDGRVGGKGGRLYRMGDGIAIEPQKFPDAPNQADFPSARIEPGTPYRHVIVFRPSLCN